MARYVEELENHYRDNPGIFEDIFGDNLPCFDLILQNLADTVAAQFSADFYASREQVMYENFLRAHSRDPQGKFFAHLTMEHIYQRQVKIGSLADANRLGMLLCQEDSPAQGVVSIGALYRDSEFRFYYGRYWNYDVFNSFIDNPPLFQTAAVSDYTLFKLTGDNSPFSWGPYSIINPTGGAATDYYQYMLLIKNSLPATPNLLPPAH